MTYVNSTNCTSENLLISVVLPVFNCEKYVRHCIQSILSQTYENFELIIIDDGSTDCSGRICDEFRSDKRVQVYHQDNRGLSYARNIGCDKAVGSHIVFVDSDDYLNVNALALFVQIYNETNADIIVADFLRVQSHRIVENTCDTLHYYHLSNAMAIERLFSDSHDEFKFGTAWGKMFSASLIHNHPFPVGKYWEDVFVLYKLYDDATLIVSTNALLYYYYQNQHGITGSPISIRNLDYLDALFERLQYIKAKYPQFLTEARRDYVNKCNELYNKAMAISNLSLADDIKGRLQNVE